MRGKLFAPIFIISLSFFGCKGTAKNYSATFVDRSDVFLPDQKPNPLLLIVELTEDGKLSLNKIETGTIADASSLSEKLKVIFDDREKAAISEREVVIDLKGKIKSEDLENLIENLANVKASPIRIVKNNL